MSDYNRWRIVILCHRLPFRPQRPLPLGKGISLLPENSSPFTIPLLCVCVKRKLVCLLRKRKRERERSFPNANVSNFRLNSFPTNSKTKRHFDSDSFTSSELANGQMQQEKNTASFCWSLFHWPKRNERLYHSFSGPYFTFFGPQLGASERANCTLKWQCAVRIALCVLVQKWGGASRRKVVSSLANFQKFADFVRSLSLSI